MSDREWFSLGLVSLAVLAFWFLGGMGWSMMGMGGPMMGMGGPMMGGWTGAGGRWWSPAVNLGFVLLIGVGIYLLVTRSKPSQRVESDKALAIVRERYAQGEISRKEFEEIKESLS